MDLIRVKNVNKQYKNGVTAIYDLSINNVRIEGMNLET